jgi:IS30 family transposase
MPKVVGYFGVVASMKALSRRQKDRKLMRHPALRELIIERTKDGWTPEQIAGRLVLSRISSGLFRAMFAMKERTNGKEIHRRVSA